MLFHGLVAGPEEIESQEWVFVAPFADRFATFGGNEAATGCPNCDVVVYEVRKPKAKEGNQCLVE